MRPDLGSFSAGIRAPPSPWSDRGIRSRLAPPARSGVEALGPWCARSFRTSVVHRNRHLARVRLAIRARILCRAHQRRFGTMHGMAGASDNFENASMIFVRDRIGWYGSCGANRDHADGSANRRRQFLFKQRAPRLDEQLGFEVEPGDSRERPWVGRAKAIDAAHVA